MLQSQTRGEQGDEDQWLEIQHLRQMLREKDTELRAAMVHIGFLEDHLEALRKIRVEQHLSGGTR